MEKLIKALLNDDNGISEDAYHELLDFLATWFDPKVSDAEHMRANSQRLYDLVRNADATDGRFYFSK